MWDSIVDVIALQLFAGCAVAAVLGFMLIARMLLRLMHGP